MANLPIELWHSIFDHLPLIDLSSCALVSKAVYLAVKEYRIREIAFTGRVYQWFHYTTPTTYYKHWVDFTMVSILKRSSFDFDYLKRLRIGRQSAIDLDLINKFTKLEELDIDLANYNYSSYKNKSRTLSLPNLKVLYLFIPDRILLVKLDTPRLAKVYTFHLKKLEFVYPESVQCIHTSFHGKKLSMFRNLEYLTFTDCYNQLDYHDFPFFVFYDFRSFDDFIVSDMKKLKEIDYYYHNNKYEEKNMSVFKRITESLLNLGRPDLKVFWFHVQMTDPNLLIEYELTMKKVGSLVAFQLQHYEELKKKAHFFWSYGFNVSMKKLSRAGFNVKSEEITSKLLSRYSFRKIYVLGQVEEREHLLDLIAGSPDLFILEFWSIGLDQSFFDRMADIIQLNAIPLQQLQVKETLNESLNLNFVSKLNDLEWFETNQELSSGLIAKLLRLPSLVKIKCSSGRNNKRIERLSTNQFLLNGQTLSLQGLMEHFEA